MKKKVLLALAAAMAVSSISFASPLSNYEKGNMAVDLNISLSPDVDISGIDLDAKSRLGFGMTYGIGDKLALQYKYADNKTKDYSYLDVWSGGYESGSVNAQLSGHELNVLYKIDPNVSAFAGLTRATAKLNASYLYVDSFGSSSEDISYKQSKSGYHVGIIGQTKISDNLTGWASVSAGNRITGYELGVGYDVAKNTEVNLFYRHTKYKDFNIEGDKFDVTTKGLGAGVTLKF